MTRTEPIRRSDPPKVRRRPRKRPPGSWTLQDAKARLSELVRRVHSEGLWLGHSSVETTEIYLQADPTDKMTVLERVKVPKLRRGSFRPPDKLIASLKQPGSC